MADTLFVNATTTVPGTPIVAAWMNDVNTNTYTILASVAGTNNITGTAASTVLVGYPRGVAFRFIVINSNTGPCTINISGLGVKNITKFGAAPLAAGDLLAGSWAYLTYDGTQFQLINALGPLAGTDTYITTAGTTTAYTTTFGGSFALFSGNAIKLIFNATNTSTTPTLNVNGSGAIAMKVMDANGNKINPIVGAFAINTPATAIYDGVDWLVVVEYPTGKLLNVQTFSANGTYTPTPGTTRIVVQVQGAGGAGGGAPAAGAGNTSAGGGGGAGGYAESFITSGFSGAAVTVGTGGTGVAGAIGNSGTATSFGAFISITGGGGGGVGSNSTAIIYPGGTGGVPTGGTITNITGASGDGGWVTTAALLGQTGKGADSRLGVAGALIPYNTTINANQSGFPATGFGAGGSGARAANGAGAAQGGAGAGGYVIVYEYS